MDVGKHGAVLKILRYQCTKTSREKEHLLMQLERQKNEALLSLRRHKEQLDKVEKQHRDEMRFLVGSMVPSVPSTFMEKELVVHVFRNWRSRS